jgi:glutathione S-transferase
VKLYYDPISTACRPVMLFAAEHGIDFEHEVVELMSGEHMGEDYGRVNPNQIVPFLVDGDFAMGEVSAILKYLAEKTGSKAYPKGLQTRARVNEWMDWFNTQFHRDYCGFLVYPQVLPADHMPPGAMNLVAYGAEHSPRWLKVLDAQLADKAFVCGEEITLADYLGSALVSLGELIAFDLTPWPNVARWMRTMKARPAWAMANAGFNGWQSAIQSQAAA